MEPDATVAVGFAGTLPYFTRRHCYDALGKCDAYIARLPAHPEIERAGHNKFDMSYTIMQHKPDAIVHAFSSDLSEFRTLYAPIMVNVDGSDCLLCVRQGVERQSGQVVTWSTASEHVRKQFATLLAR